MKKLVLFSFLITTLFQIADAQESELFVKSGNKGLFIEHKVSARQGLYAVGRLYNVHPKHIAEYNGIGLNDGLSLGQTLRIPLTDTNFSQKGYSGTPVYYRVGSTGENLDRISRATKNVPTSLIKEWNNLKGEVPRSGVKLVIGFLHSDELPVVTLNQPQKQEPEKLQVEEKPVVKKEEVAKTEIKDEPKKEEPKKEEPKPVVKEEPEKKEEKPLVKEEPKKEEPKPVVTKQPEPRVSNNPVEEGSGYFKAYFDEQVKTSPASKNITVTSGIFKTTSGVKEAKYYMLIDGALPGTIIRITNPANNKTVYAKVLGEMNGIRLNQGYDIRISESAATALAVTETDKFIVQVNY